MDEADLHKLTLDELSALERKIKQYWETWFGFSPEGRERRTPEWIEAASWRLAGKIEPCCECGESYPQADLHFRGDIYCPRCREDVK